MKKLFAILAVIILPCIGFACAPDDTDGPMPIYWYDYDNGVIGTQALPYPNSYAVKECEDWSGKVICPGSYTFRFDNIAYLNRPCWFVAKLSDTRLTWYINDIAIPKAEEYGTISPVSTCTIKVRYFTGCYPEGGTGTSLWVYTTKPSSITVTFSGVENLQGTNGVIPTYYVFQYATKTKCCINGFPGPTYPDYNAWIPANQVNNITLYGFGTVDGQDCSPPIENLWWIWSALDIEQQQKNGQYKDPNGFRIIVSCIN